MFDDDDQDTDFAATGVVLAQAGLPGHKAAIWLVHRDRALPMEEWAEQWPCANAASVTELLQQWDTHQRELRQLTELPQTARAIAETGLPVAALRLEAPLLPTQLFCTIGNYRRQVIEAAIDGGDPAEADRLRAATEEALDQRSRDGAPYVCLTSIDRVGAPLGELVLDPDLDTLDWEVEIGAVIGTSGSRLTPSEAQGVIAGYCVVNDLTIRSRVVRPDLPVLGSDWLQCKGLRGSLPLGPWFVPAWQIPAPSGLRLRLSLNDQLMQDDTADDMVFNIPEQLSYLSQHTRLGPGDVLCTGSPAGFGVHHGRFLRAGDTVKASVTGLGQQITRCVDPHSTQADPT
ncbi:fumarylacetoacetate hydrolase family protein [Arthrobacter sp. BE255]|uniref:fumarylacetoacetate hydrolase family protein n=1 Tax=Arthrobacter sp. BE255 TaxID=2817721 RepID=UPI00285AE703|nr:fumarylacetoacetate hydrolase family protein [Arthrobacter sp. BE255]MDR7158127.1 2-keto-4-pentenoate hydratase/2-oxohepta-3-ene-1,7-dioic acid hydratase in catechol pathway [Arthrobacter sp. BE255]